MRNLQENADASHGGPALSPTGFLSRLMGNDHERSARAARNILVAAVFQGTGLVLSLLLVPITLAYLGPLRYGVWVTVTSALAWFSFADLGVGNGLRNRLGESLARGDRALGRRYVSVAYGVVGIVAASASGLFLGLFPFLPWGRAFNAPADLAGEVGLLVLWVGLFWAGRLVVQQVAAVLLADERSGVVSGVFTAAQALVLVAVLALMRLPGPPSLPWLGFLVSAVPFSVLLGLSLWWFWGRYRDLKPTLHGLSLRLARELMGLGGGFFLLQMSAVVIYMTDNIIVAQLLGPAAVTPYNILYKYFWSVTLFFGLVGNQYWSAVVTARAQGDQAWIRTAFRRVLLLALAASGLVLVMALASGPVLRLWVGKNAPDAPLLLWLMALYICQQMVTNALSAFTNGFGAIRVNVLAAVGGALVNIPLCVALASVGTLGSGGVVLAGMLSLLPSTVLLAWQLHLHLAGRSTGIWAR